MARKWKAVRSSFPRSGQSSLQGATRISRSSPAPLRAEMGCDEAVVRADAELAVGADMAFVETAQTPEAIAAIPRLAGRPNVAPRIKTPPLNLRRGQTIGHRLAILPEILIKSVVKKCDRVLLELQKTGLPPRALQWHHRRANLLAFRLGPLKWAQAAFSNAKLEDPSWH